MVKRKYMLLLEFLKPSIRNVEVLYFLSLFQIDHIQVWKLLNGKPLVEMMLSWPTFNQSSIHLCYEFSISRINFNWTVDINTWKKKTSETNHERLSWRNLPVGTMQEEHASLDTSHF
jgi:hypothetical protein